MFPTSTTTSLSTCVKSIALVGQNFSQALQVPFSKYVQFGPSMTGYFGTACGKGM